MLEGQMHVCHGLTVPPFRRIFGKHGGMVMSDELCTYWCERPLSVGDLVSLRLKILDALKKFEVFPCLQRSIHILARIST